jgi:hypothetical protein
MAACLVQNGLLSEPLDTFSDPTQQKVAIDKAGQLLRSILPENTWAELEEKGFIQFAGKRGTYLISPHTQTEIRDAASGRCVAYACLQLSIPAPTYDRMIAEYLLIRNAEDVYWKTANIFSGNRNESGITTLFLIALDIALFVNLLLEVVPAARFGQ